jgi:hypothetical protein
MFAAERAARAVPPGLIDGTAAGASIEDFEIAEAAVTAVVRTDPA